MNVVSSRDQCSVADSMKTFSSLSKLSPGTELLCWPGIRKIVDCKSPPKATAVASGIRNEDKIFSNIDGKMDIKLFPKLTYPEWDHIQQ